MGLVEDFCSVPVRHVEFHPESEHVGVSAQVDRLEVVVDFGAQVLGFEKDVGAPVSSTTIPFIATCFNPCNQSK